MAKLEGKAAATSESYEWSFRYQGVPGSALAAIDRHNEKSAPVPPVVVALIKGEIEAAASHTKEVIVVARGDAGLEGNTARNIFVEVCFRD